MEESPQLEARIKKKHKIRLSISKGEYAFANQTCRKGRLLMIGTGF